MHIGVLPYFPVRQSASVGGWRLITAASPDAGAFIDADTLAKAQGLLRLYGAGEGARVAGAFACPPGGRVGDDVPVEELSTLHRAIVAGLLEGNPTPPALVEDEEEVDPNG